MRTVRNVSNVIQPLLLKRRRREKEKKKKKQKGNRRARLSKKRDLKTNPT